MKLLIACNDYPYPADHGGRVDMWGRIQVLREMGCTVDLIVCTAQTPGDEELAEMKRYARRILACPRRTRPADLLGGLPLQVLSRRSLAEAEIGEAYDAVLLEGDYVYPVLHNPTLRYGEALLRVHNDERAYFRALAGSTKRPLHKLYYWSESYKFGRLARRLLQETDGWLFISSKEEAAFRARYPERRSVFLPPPVARGRFAPAPLTAARVVFIGSLFMPNNREAIDWYLRRVHPQLIADPEYRFVIAGNSRGQGLGWLQAYDLSRVELHDSPPSLDAIYRSGYLFVNPMRHGAGVKLKTIEAIQHGLPVVSTSIGCEGTGLADGKQIRIADTADGFAAAVRELLGDRRAALGLLAAAQAYIREHYDHRRVLERALGMQPGAAAAHGPQSERQVQPGQAAQAVPR
ncbi:glycosyltransferase family 4 protein [Paenibacillus sp. IB182496]|uniref:Glycosyltransferase family 4 protein n=1 Tax=Paenibacillus sabuli TaxID=2772509 RepID=A0A927C0D2_9BACL|nr:glycosyltransferase family 4 protein [Paenibacillus sabuli]MBD2848588.1 glycosyltransferase family 4 protein [Paenibacillus sabuli]